MQDCVDGTPHETLSKARLKLRAGLCSQRRIRVGEVRRSPGKSHESDLLRGSRRRRRPGKDARAQEASQYQIHSCPQEEKDERKESLQQELKRHLSTGGLFPDPSTAQRVSHSSSGVSERLYPLRQQTPARPAALRYTTSATASRGTTDHLNGRPPEVVAIAHHCMLQTLL